jgi:hypothetical protein
MTGGLLTGEVFCALIGRHLPGGTLFACRRPGGLMAKKTKQGGSSGSQQTGKKKRKEKG